MSITEKIENLDELKIVEERIYFLYIEEEEC